MKKSKIDFLKQLTWADIQNWGGDTITSRGKSYQASHLVRDLSVTPKDTLIAWVQGTEQYATRVDVEDGRLVSNCTCPFEGTCKHAVAVVIEYLEQLKHHSKIPVVDEDDERLVLLEAETANDYSEVPEEIDAKRKVLSSKTKTDLNKLYTYLEKLDKSKILDLLVTIVQRYPEAREFLMDHFHLSGGEVNSLVYSIRKELDRLSREPAWIDKWNRRGNIPDYSGVRNRLEMLLSKGYADEVLDLGKRLLEAGVAQVEESNDEGETAAEISSCLDVVFRALPDSNLSTAEQIMWMIEAELSDEYDLTQSARTFWEKDFPASDWEVIANNLLLRLDSLKSDPGSDDFTNSYYRDCISDWTITALRNAGRMEEIIPLCRQEALKTDRYDRLVHELIDANRHQEAAEWIDRGIKATQESKAGIASSLREIFRELKEKEGDWLGAAALRGDDFFVRPGLNSFLELQRASEKAGVWPQVRNSAMHYLETGKLPSHPSWPLPETGIKEPVKREPGHFPLVRALIEIAMHEKQTAEVVRWYNHYLAHSLGTPGYLNLGYLPEDTIAEFIFKKYPETSIAIWQKLAEELIRMAQVGAYERAFHYLSKINQVYRQLGNEAKWKDYLAGLRASNLRKRRLQEILDGLEEKPVIET
jgi:uncharacterized Zn finger protein